MLDPTTYDILDSGDQLPLLPSLLLSLGFVTIALSLIASLVCMLIRFRRSRGEQRQQLRLIASAAAVLTFGIVCLFVVQVLNGGHQTFASAVPLFVSYTLLPVLFAVAVLRYRLYDVDVIINRALVLAIGTIFAAIGYIALVVVVGKLVEGRTSGFRVSLLATALIALAFQPLRRGVVRFAHRLAYGARAPPYEALADFSSRLAETPSPDTLLPAVADAAGRAVSARGASATLEVSGVAGSLSATWGDLGGAGTETHAVSVTRGDVRLGTIEVAIPRGRGLHASDTRLLQALADQTAVAFSNTATAAQLASHVAQLDRTTLELAASRARIIEAEDEARRVLEESISRDVLPYLVSVRDRLTPQLDGTGIAGLVADTNTALEALRELTRGVFPTQLARAGIDPALRSFLSRSGLASRFVLDPSAEGRRFSARVEAAVYYCCTEAARTVPGLTSILLALDGDVLRVEVRGAGVDEVDLRPVTDRADAVGGSLLTENGLLVLQIPVGADEPELVSAGGGPGL